MTRISGRSKSTDCTVCQPGASAESLRVNPQSCRRHRADTVCARGALGSEAGCSRRLATRTPHPSHVYPRGRGRRWIGLGVWAGPVTVGAARTGLGKRLASVAVTDDEPRENSSNSASLLESFQAGDHGNDSDTQASTQTGKTRKRRPPAGWASHGVPTSSSVSYDRGSAT
jgi:hypothetical protein